MAINGALLGIGQGILNSFTQDLVAVYNQDMKQVFKEARPLKVTVKPDSKLMEHPLEDGSFVADHRIILQNEIEISAMVQSSNFRNVYQEIFQIFTNGDILTVQTKASTYQNMVIMSPPHDEDPDIFSTIIIAIKLKEVQFAITGTADAGTVLAPRNPTDSDTKVRGNQPPKEATPANTGKASTAYELFF